ncbi:MAG: site-specific integrase [Bryobacteraceae bacterium]
MTTQRTLLRTQPFDESALLKRADEIVATLRLNAEDKRKAVNACNKLGEALDRCRGRTLQDRWNDFERSVWPKWSRGKDGPCELWTWGARVIIPARVVVPTMSWLSDVHITQWIERFPDNDPLVQQYDLLLKAAAGVRWASPHSQRLAVCSGIRLLLTHDYDTVQQIKDEDLKALTLHYSKGMNVLDAALCALGVFSRSPKHGSTRHSRRRMLTVPELVQVSGTPERFGEVTILYLETYMARVSDSYKTRRAKVVSIAHFWRFMVEKHPEVSCSQVLPRHAREYIPYALARAREVQRGESPGKEESTTGSAWLVNIQTFFTDLCAWASEPDSPLHRFAPRTVPLTRRSHLGLGFEKARQRTRARITARVLDLEREIPKIRAYAMRRWNEAAAATNKSAKVNPVRTEETDRFWEWALLELFVQSGLRIEEASEVSTLDILKRNSPDGSIYYLLHVKPSKFDRARVIPIGDGLGRMIAEIIRHVKSFHGTDYVPVCDHRKVADKVPRPPAPYLIQGLRHPAPPGLQTIRARVRAVSVGAGARRSDGSPLLLLPHDCRRIFASEHLNNNTPVHVIQALLGHGSPDTVMIYAKLYPHKLIEEYRKTVRGLYNAYYGADPLKNPTAAEWAAFAASCNLRDMGTHLCALPTGEHCPRGLVCLGCTHAQPKKSAVPIFRRMLASHGRSLVTAKIHNEPAGQIAARELELVRIKGALQRAEELSVDVATAMEEV